MCEKQKDGSAEAGNRAKELHVTAASGRKAPKEAPTTSPEDDVPK